MKKKTALVLISLMTLTALLTTPSYVPQTAALTGKYHYRIRVSQISCYAKIQGYLTDIAGNKIKYTDFKMICCEDYAEWKVATNVTARDISFNLWIDWNKDCAWDAPYTPTPVNMSWTSLPWSNSWKSGGRKVTVEVTQLTTPLHWKIKLAQKDCNARIIGFLSDQTGGPITCTDFDLNCSSNFVYKKIVTPNCTIPHDISFDLLIDWNKDGIYEDPRVVSSTWEMESECKPGEIVKQWPWQYVVVNGLKMVVVEVEEQEYDPADGWQFTVKQENVDVIWTGWLTNKTHAKISGSDFLVECICTKMQCQVVKIPWCTEPYDIHYDLFIFSKEGPLINETHVDKDIPQFPWRWEKVGFDSIAGKGYKVELELEHVQMHRYVIMGGEMDSAGFLTLGGARWSIGDWELNGGTPFGTRKPLLTPLIMGYNITFTQRDPITGIVKLGIPAESYVGVSHIWYGNDTDLWYNMTISLKQQGCGYLFTGQGKNPIYGDVDLLTFNNWSGVFSLKPGHMNELLAGELGPWTGHPNPAPAYGAGPPLGPCLQKLSGPDGIPGTDDDPIGDGTPDPAGSSILYLPTKMTTYYWYIPPIGEPYWFLLFSSDWPQLTTTGSASDVVIESESPIDGESASVSGQPWEFVAGLDHPGNDDIPHTGDAGEYEVYWKHEKCNAYVTYACAWSVLRVYTSLGWLEICFPLVEKAVREDCLIMDISCDEVVDIEDVVTCALAFGGKDEGRYWDGTVWKWRRYASPPRARDTIGAADTSPPQGEVDIGDIVVVAVDFGAKLTPDCILGRRG